MIYPEGILTQIMNQINFHPLLCWYVDQFEASTSSGTLPRGHLNSLRMVRQIPAPNPTLTVAFDSQLSLPPSQRKIKMYFFLALLLGSLHHPTSGKVITLDAFSNWMQHFRLNRREWGGTGWMLNFELISAEYIKLRRHVLLMVSYSAYCSLSQLSGSTTHC